MRDGTMSRQKRSVEKTIKTTLKMAFPSVGVLSLDAFIPGPRVCQQLGISAVRFGDGVKTTKLIFRLASA
jgi:hypothetical protein